jgi:manganese oxidase
MRNRRTFFQAAGASLLGAAAVSRAGAAVLPEVVMQASPATQLPPSPPTGRPFQPLVTLNGWSLPWRMKNNVKEFHLVAEPVVREIAPGMKANLWGYNGTSPGPTIEAVEGDRIRIFVTNMLPEVTSVHWHGILLPSGMDGVTGLTQPPIEVGKTFMYEFVLQRSGTFMYHPHADEIHRAPQGPEAVQG